MQEPTDREPIHDKRRRRRRPCLCCSVAVFSISLCWPTTLAVNGCCVSVDLIPETDCLQLACLCVVSANSSLQE
jgi:hypothetical protein